MASFFPAAAVFPLEAVVPLLASMLVPNLAVVSPLLARSSLSGVAELHLEVLALLAAVVSFLTAAAPLLALVLRLSHPAQWHPS